MLRELKIRNLAIIDRGQIIEQGPMNPASRP